MAHLEGEQKAEGTQKVDLQRVVCIGAAGIAVCTLGLAFLLAFLDASRK
jgi:hypothetical protein